MFRGEGALRGEGARPRTFLESVIEAGTAVIRRRGGGAMKRPKRRRGGQARRRGEEREEGPAFRGTVLCSAEEVKERGKGRRRGRRELREARRWERRRWEGRSEKSLSLRAMFLLRTVRAVVELRGVRREEEAGRVGRAGVSAAKRCRRLTAAVRSKNKSHVPKE